MNKTRKRTEYYLAGLVAALAFLVYLPALRCGFLNWDDEAFYKDPHLHHLNVSFLVWAFSGFRKAMVGNWIPLTMVSHALDYAIWGPDPMGPHLTNIILHAANTFIVVVLAVRLAEAWEQRMRNMPGAAGFNGPAGAMSSIPGAWPRNWKLIAGVATGLLFGLHPLHVESVAWASERKDVLCALFFLLGLLFYVKYGLARLGHVAGRPQSQFPSPNSPAVTYLLCLFLFALALMSKPMAVSLPIVLLLLDWFPLGRLSGPGSLFRALLEKLPFAALSAGDSALTLMAQKGAVMTAVQPSTRLLVAAKSLVLYLWKIMVPLDLVPFYPYPRPAAVSFGHAAYFLSVLLLAGVTAACLMAAGRRKPLFLAAWGYFLVTLLPVLGIVQVGEQSMADRYTYLPSLGPFLVLGLAAAWAWEKASAPRRGGTIKTVMAVAALCAVLSMSWLTVRQTGIWRNSLVFWSYVIRKDAGTRDGAAYVHRGMALWKAGRTREALADVDHALAMDPADFMGYFHRGCIYKEAGRLDLAFADYSRAIALHPAFSEAYYDRGNIFAETGRPGLAIADYSNAIKADPRDSRAWCNRGILLAGKGQLNAALEDLDRSIVLDPGQAVAYADRGNLYLQEGGKIQAARDFRMACRLGDAQACNFLWGPGGSRP